MLSSLPRGTEMFQFPRLPPYTYAFSVQSSPMTVRGFPHSDIFGSTPVSGSPKLFAACHVLHRLLLPRHPPSALYYLNRVIRPCSNALPSFTSNPRVPSRIGPFSLSSYSLVNELRPTPAPVLVRVEMSGLEPPTSCVQGRRSPS